MFCTKCGQVVDEGFAFCPKCGGKIDSSITPEGANQPPQFIGESIKEKNNTVPYVFAERVESTKDKTVNDYLFTLFAKLIKPVKKIEEDENKISGLQDSIKDLKTKKATRSHYILLVILAITLAILTLYFRARQEIIIENNPATSAVLQAYLDNSRSFSSVDCSGISLWDRFVIAYDWPHTHSLILLLLYYIGFPFMAFFIMGLCIQNLIRKMKTDAAYKKALSQIPAIKQQIVELQEDEDKVVNAISQYICFCPPSYRTSTALAYFADSYRNTRVSNLQEAINKYDEYLRHEEMMDVQMKICISLDEISFNTETLYSQIRDMNRQLKTINTSIWLN